MTKKPKNKFFTLLIQKCKPFLFAGGFAITLLLLCFIFYKGYTSASHKYEALVSQLKGEVAELSDVVAQYTVASSEVTLDLIASEIKDIGDLTTVEYLYTDAGKFENARQLFHIDIPFTTKSFIVKWDGIIKAGIRVEDISIAIDDTTKEILITLPKAEILSHEIDNDSIETLDEQGGLFNPVKVEDVREFDSVNKESMEARALENGLLEKASENARRIIEKLVYNEIIEEQGYTIRFEDAL